MPRLKVKKDLAHSCVDCLPEAAASFRQLFEIREQVKFDAVLAAF